MELNIIKILKVWVLASLIIISGCHTIKMEAIDQRQVESDVLAAFQGLVKASESLDSKKYFAYFDREKFTGLNADGKVWHSIEGLESLIDSAFPMIEKSISLEFKNVKVTVLDQHTAILVNEFKQTLLLKNGSLVNQAGGGTQVWVKSQDSWKLVSVSASLTNH